MDFSIPRRSIRFRVDDDVFEATPEIPVDVALEFADHAERLERADVSEQEKFVSVRRLLELLLRGDSAERFVARLGDRDNPIGVQQFVKIIQWLFGEYGLRPTESGSESFAGPSSPEFGTSSTASTSDAGSTSGYLALTGSSTSPTPP